MNVKKLLAIAAGLTLLTTCGFGDSRLQKTVDSVLAHPDNNLAWVTGSVSKGTLILTGTAPTDQAQADAAALLIQIPGVETVLDQTVLDTAFVRRKGEKEVCEAGVLTTLEGSQIEFSGTTLRSQSRAILDQIAVVLTGCPDTSVEVAGHTDDTGSEAANLRVSEQRAKATADYLIGKGLDATRFTSVGHGESQPIADNGTAAGRTANRRVEFHLMF